MSFITHISLHQNRFTLENEGRRLQLAFLHRSLLLDGMWMKKLPFSYQLFTILCTLRFYIYFQKKKLLSLFGSFVRLWRHEQNEAYVHTIYTYNAIERWWNVHTFVLSETLHTYPSTYLHTPYRVIPTNFGPVTEIKKIIIIKNCCKSHYLCQCASKNRKCTCVRLLPSVDI